MKKSEFLILCNTHCVDVNLALEYPEIIEALKNREDERVEELMDELF